MNTLWNYIDQKTWEKEKKYKVLLFLVSVIAAMVGFFTWLIIQNWICSTWEWMLCFMGYPILIAWITAFIKVGS